MRSIVLKAAMLLWLPWLLAGCSALRLGYDNGPMLAWWWVDGYGDFSAEQAPRVKDGIQSWFNWHRKTQLPEYAAWLAATRSKIGDSVTSAQLCRWYDEARRLTDPALDRALVTAVPWVAGLSETQLRHIERRQAKTIDEFRRDFLQSDPAERRQAATKRALERFEMVYGDFDESQTKMVAELVRASPFDPEAWLAERLRRQRDAASTLRRLVAERADADQTLAALRTLTERSERSPDPAYRAYQLKLTEYNCAFTAKVHNALKPAQRDKGRKRLEGWEEDLRALAAGAN